jgi:DMSO/TMAO reductase YedYZ heme-binding membrane subunit
MAAISFDIAIQRMGFRLWKSVQRFVYIALVLTIAHLVTSNTEYNSLGGFIPAISLLGLIFLLYLETRRIIVNRHASMARVKQS